MNGYTSLIEVLYVLLAVKYGEYFFVQ